MQATAEDFRLPSLSSRISLPLRPLHSSSTEKRTSCVAATAHRNDRQTSSIPRVVVRIFCSPAILPFFCLICFKLPQFVIQRMPHRSLPCIASLRRLGACSRRRAGVERRPPSRSRALSVWGCRLHPVPPAGRNEPSGVKKAPLPLENRQKSIGKRTMRGFIGVGTDDVEG